MVVLKQHGDRYVVENEARGDGRRWYKAIQAAERIKFWNPPPEEKDSESVSDED